MTVPFNYFKRATACITAATGLLLGAASLDADILYTDIDGTSVTADGPAVYTGTLNDDVTWDSEVFVSYTVTYTGDGLGNNDFVGFWLGNNSGPNFGFKGNEDDSSVPVNDRTGNDIFIRNQYTGESFIDGLEVESGDSLFVIAGFSKSGTSSVYNQFNLWVTDLTSGDVFSTTDDGPSGISSFSTIGIRAANLDRDTETNTSEDQFDFSNIIVASTYDEAFAGGVIPEPSTWALSIGLLAIGGFIYRRRRN